MHLVIPGDDSWRPRANQTGCRVKDEMRRLLEKHPDGIDGFKEDILTSEDSEVSGDEHPVLDVDAAETAPLQLAGKT